MLAKEAALHTPVQEPPAPAAQVMLMPLAMAEAGKTVEVHAIRGKDEVPPLFAATLALSEGAQVSVVSELNGNMIVNVKGTRVAISKSMASPYPDSLISIYCEAGNQGRIHMRTLKEAKCGETVSVAKLTGEGALKRRHHGYGHHKGHTDLCAQGCAVWATRSRSTYAATSFRSARARRKTFFWKHKAFECRPA